MKKLTVLLVLAGMLISAGCRTGGIIGGGYGGETNSANLTLEVVEIEQNWQGRDSLIGIGFTIIFNGGELPSDTESTTGSWSDWYQYEAQVGYLTDEEIRRDWPEMGVFGKYGIEIEENSNLFINAIGGITFADEIHLWTSELGPPHYTEEHGWNVYGLYGIGISYLLDNGTYIQTDYDNRRGITVGVGWKF